MHLTTLLLFPLLSFPQLHALTTTSSPSSLTHTNLTLPRLLPPPPNNLTLPPSLGKLGPSCFDPAPRVLGPVSLDSCLNAIPRIAANLPPEVYLLPRVFKTAAAVDIPGGTKVPISWKSGPGGCMVQMDSVKGMAGLPDAGEISLIGAAYYASLVVATCVLGEKNSVGGRFVIEDGGLFVDVRAAPVGVEGDDAGVGGREGLVATE